MLQNAPSLVRCLETFIEVITRFYKRYLLIIEPLLLNQVYSPMEEWNSEKCATEKVTKFYCLILFHLTVIVHMCVTIKVSCKREFLRIYQKMSSRVSNGITQSIFLSWSTILHDCYFTRYMELIVQYSRSSCHSVSTKHWQPDREVGEIWSLSLRFAHFRQGTSVKCSFYPIVDENLQVSGATKNKKLPIFFSCGNSTLSDETNPSKVSPA